MKKLILLILIDINKIIHSRQMSKEFIEYIKTYIHQVICGFESGIYKMITQTNPDKLKYLANNHQPFIPLFRDLHETYYTSTFNSIVRRDDKYVIDTFDKFQNLSKHSKQCLLNILANLIVSVHFNLNRIDLQIENYNIYMKTLQAEITNVISVIDLVKLFDHKCEGLSDTDLKVLSDGEKFITIKMTLKSNGVNKEINSFVIDESIDNTDLNSGNE